jgi:hypothetical protein
MSSDAVAVPAVAVTVALPAAYEEMFDTAVPVEFVYTTALVVCTSAPTRPVTVNVTGTPATADPAEFLTTADAVAEVAVAPDAPAEISVVVVPGITSVSPVDVRVIVAGALAAP